jgi:hypothetical protein
MKKASLGAFMVALMAPTTRAVWSQDAQAATIKHIVCVIGNATKFDDGKMKPKKLAQVVQPSEAGPPVATPGPL